MPRCEMCGTKESSLTTIKTSQAQLDVCESCEDLGTTVETENDTPDQNTKYSTTNSSSSETKSRSTQSTDEGDNLRMDYGEVIRSARERRDLSVTELAREMNEKASHLRGIENEERQPTQQLQTQLESKLDISLSADSEDVDDYESDNVSGTTLGDVVEFDG